MAQNRAERHPLRRAYGFVPDWSARQPSSMYGRPKPWLLSGTLAQILFTLHCGRPFRNCRRFAARLSLSREAAGFERHRRQREVRISELWWVAIVSLK